MKSINLKRYMAASLALWLDMGMDNSSSKALHDFNANYGHDFFLPLIVYFCMPRFNEEINPSDAALMTFGVMSAGEIAQYLGLYRGTFDPKDFLAYAAGATTAYAIDKLVFRKKNE